MSLVQNLIHDYGDFKVDIKYWEIPDRGVTALLGQSGSGKTSIFRLLLGLDYCRSLSWQFGDLDLAKLDIPDRRIGVVFQQYELFPHLTAYENIKYAAEARKVNDWEETLVRLSQTLNMQSYLRRPVHYLSGGEQQRVAIVRALIGEPRILFLDEPFAALDVGLRREARDLVSELISHLEIPCLLITHDEADIKALANSVFIVESGRIRSGDES